MTTKHTPAPWRVSRADHDGAGVHAIACVAWCGVSSTYGQTPETTQHIDADECAANARLIAAAPDLLDALEEYHRVANAVPYAQWTPAMHKAHDAIAKAKGEKP